jgi:hypothetical protein
VGQKPWAIINSWQDCGQWHLSQNLSRTELIAEKKVASLGAQQIKRKV